MMSRRAARGFTLIELMVALAVAAALFSAVVMGLGALTGAQARKAMGELGAASRSLYDTAALSGNTCRLVFLLPKDDSAEFTYRAECANGPVTTSLDRDQEIRDATKAAVEAYRKRGRSNPADAPPPTYARSSGSTLLDVLDSEKARVEKAAAFSAFTTPEIQPRKMPRRPGLGLDRAPADEDRQRASPTSTSFPRATPSARRSRCARARTSGRCSCPPSPGRPPSSTASRRSRSREARLHPARGRGRARHPRRSR